jgi:hypothetical protein
MTNIWDSAKRVYFEHGVGEERITLICDYGRIKNVHFLIKVK